MFHDYPAQDKTQILEDINSTIDLLYITQCRATRNALLNRLRRLLVLLTTYPRQGMNFDGNVIPANAPTRQNTPQNMPQGMPGGAPPAQLNAQNQRTFTVDELARYDGKADNPAYVAINGIVYDVTDQPGWAAGSHFGLRAGLDQTSAYISCHTGQPMIDRLKVIGRLVK